MTNLQLAVLFTFILIIFAFASGLEYLVFFAPLIGFFVWLSLVIKPYTDPYVEAFCNKLKAVIRFKKQ